MRQRGMAPFEPETWLSKIGSSRQGGRRSGLRRLLQMTLSQHGQSAITCSVVLER